MRKLFATALLLMPVLLLEPVLQAASKSRSHKNHELLWQEPGDVSRRDLAYGPGGRRGEPRPPFHFLEEDFSGTNPKMKVRDARGAEWALKWGPEAFASSFSTHFVWACGYVVETEYLIPGGRITGVHGLKRAAAFVQPDGSFKDARFQLRSKWPRFLKHSNWAWTNNPFLARPEFNGLRILMMLLSNWDAKDARDLAERGAGRGRSDSNLAIFEEPGRNARYLYFVSDWGATLGKASALAPVRSKWDSQGFAAQSAEFIHGVKNGEVQWGYGGTHGADISKGIRVSDAEWLMRYLGQIGDAQIRRGLMASRATGEDLELFARALRDRIRQLERVARGL